MKPEPFLPICIEPLEPHPDFWTAFRVLRDVIASDTRTEDKNALEECGMDHVVADVDCHMTWNQIMFFLIGFGLSSPEDFAKLAELEEEVDPWAIEVAFLAATVAELEEQIERLERQALDDCSVAVANLGRPPD